MNLTNGNVSTWKQITAQYIVAACGIAVAASVVVLIPLQDSTSRQPGTDFAPPSASRHLSERATYVVTDAPVAGLASQASDADDALPTASGSSAAPYANESVDEYAAREAAQIDLTTR
ncbi:MAG TPA: hypothetical protein VJB57_08015 [Dehalococcoidia bacterium]|nr:hypothetical protein [Dehalococcoidia bacterium]